MTQEQKDLLLKDLCARLPYGVKAVLKKTNCYDDTNKVSEKDIYSFRTDRPLVEDYGQHDYYKVIVKDIKPYLFPLSSMTEEQEIEYLNTCVSQNPLCWTLETFEWLNKNHFDYNYLIDDDLANDATNLRIYEKHKRSIR